MGQKNVAGQGRPSAPDIIILSKSDAVDTRPYDHTPNHTVVAYPTAAEAAAPPRPRNAQIFTYMHVRVLMLAIYSIFKMAEFWPPLESSPESGDAWAVPVSANIRHILGTGSSAAIYVRTNLRVIMDDRVLI